MLLRLHTGSSELVSSVLIVYRALLISWIQAQQMIRD